MKKTKLFVTIFFSVLMLSIGGVVIAANQPSELITNHDLSKLSAMKISLDDKSDLNLLNSVSKIDKNAAIESANQNFPDWANDATDVTVEYHLMTNTQFSAFSQTSLDKNPTLKATGYMNKLPVYIITYKGMSYSSNVPADYKGQVPVHHEYNVVVDAATGETLMGFSYR